MNQEVCVLEMRPLPSIYRGHGHPVYLPYNTMRTLHLLWEPTRKHHVEGEHWPTLCRFGRPLGSADPTVGPMALPFGQVAVLWALRLV